MQVLDLLRHTAGFVNGEEYGATAVHRLYDGLYGKDGVWKRDRTLADFITALAMLPLAHQPGEVGSTATPSMSWRALWRWRQASRSISS